MNEAAVELKQSAEPIDQGKVWLSTYPSNEQFNPLSPQPQDIHIEDIATALSHICRYGGHVPQFYSVAQHSVLVSMMCEEKADVEAGLWGLLHDAAEAYLGDLIWPLKQIPALGEAFLGIERPLLRMIIERFGLTWPAPEIVKSADLRVLLAEARDRIGSPSAVDRRVLAPADMPYPETFSILPYDPKTAKESFLRQFFRLSNR